MRKETGLYFALGWIVLGFLIIDGTILREVLGGVCLIVGGHVVLKELH